MKKNLFNLVALIAVSLCFSTVSFAQIGNIINKAKDAIDKKKDKKAEDKPAEEVKTTTTTGSNETPSNNSQETTKTETKQSSADDTFLTIHLGFIREVQQDVENYVNGKADSLVIVYGDRNMVENAISPKARAEYLKNFATIDPEGKINAELDKLAKMIDAPMRKYHPLPNNFQFKNPAEIKMMKDLLAKENLTIHNIGVFSPSWNIRKDAYGLPQNRFKYGYVWAKDNNSDQPYCIRYQLEIVQDYAGGGTYGASFAWKTYDSTAKMFMGCPLAEPKTTTPKKPAAKRGKQ